MTGPHPQRSRTLAAVLAPSAALAAAAVVALAAPARAATLGTVDTSCASDRLGLYTVCVTEYCAPNGCHTITRHYIGGYLVSTSRD